MAYPYYPDKDITIVRGDKVWSFTYSVRLHALELSQYSVGGESLFHSPPFTASLQWNEVPVPDDVKAEALEKFNASLRVIRAYPEASLP